MTASMVSKAADSSSEEKDTAGNVTYKDCGTHETDERTYYENEATFDGENQTLTRDYAFGQVSYITTYYVEDSLLLVFH